MNETFKRKENESELDYLIRLFENKKEYDLDYQELFRLVFGIELAADECRKRYYGISMLLERYKDNLINKNPDEIKDELYVTMQDIIKERIKLSDERVSLTKTLRNKARCETIEEIALKCVENIETKNDKFTNEYVMSNGNKSMIITLSDFHYGLNTNEFNNTYNPEVFVERLEKFKSKIIDLLYNNPIEKLYIIGLGDYISGYIHSTIRIENRENVVEQVLNVSEYICQFINALSSYVNIEYRDTIGNHSRMMANRKESIDKESFDLLIHQFIKERFRDCKNIEIIESDINEKMGTLNIYNKNYAFTHGNGFSFGTIVQDMSLLTGKFYDAIFIGHFHHQSMDEQQRCYVYASGSLSGNDSYSNKIRKTSNPSQNIYILNENDGIECQYIVKL